MVKRTGILQPRLGLVAALAVAVVAVAGIVSCGKIESTTLEQGPFQSVPALGQFTVYGSVSVDGSPIEGVVVSADGGEKTASTGAQGVYRISLAAGEHTLDFTKEGFKDVTKIVSGVALAEVILDVGMTAGSTPDDKKGRTFTVTPGARQERSVSGPGRLEFDLTGMDNPNPELKQHIAWGYEPGKGFSGGQGSGGAEWGLRTYKLKVFGAGGDFASEPRYDVRWDRNKTYHVIVEWSDSGVWVDIDGERAAVATRLPSKWVIGIGWPPAVREGITGAQYSRIKWP